MTRAPVRSRDRRLIVLVTAGAYFMVTLDALVVVTALPSIHRDLGGGPGGLPWIVDAYALTFAAGILTASALGDRLGRRRVYRSGLVLFTLSSAACALAPGLGVLIAFRAAQGLGAAVVMPLGLTLLTSSFPRERRGTVVGIWGGIAGLGVASGPLIGGAVTAGLNWHWVFWVNVPIGIAAVIASGVVLAETPGTPTPVDVLGAATGTAAVAALVWGALQAPQTGWTGGRTLAGVGLGLVLLAGFILREASARHPMIPLSLFRSRTFASAGLTTFLMSGAIFSTAYLTSQFFQLGLGEGPFDTGLRFLPWTATPLLVAPIAGRLVDRVGARALAVPGLLMQAIGFLGILRAAHTQAGYPGYIAPFVIAGIGVSMALPCPPAAGLNAAPAELLGRAAGVLNTLQQLGAALTVAAVTVVFDSKGSLASPAATLSGFQPALTVAATVSVIGAVAALGLSRSPRPALEGVEPGSPVGSVGGIRSNDHGARSGRLSGIRGG